jgi:hypothetical protein
MRHLGAQSKECNFWKWSGRWVNCNSDSTHFSISCHLLVSQRAVLTPPNFSGAGLASGNRPVGGSVISRTEPQSCTWLHFSKPTAKTRAFLTARTPRTWLVQLPLYRWRNWGPNRRRTLPKLTERVGNQISRLHSLGQFYCSLHVLLSLGPVFHKV